MSKSSKAKTLNRATGSADDSVSGKERPRSKSVFSKSVGALKGKLWKRNRSNFLSETCYSSSKSSTLPTSRHKPLESDDSLVKFDMPVNGRGPIKSFHYSMEEVFDEVAVKDEPSLERKDSTESADSGVESSTAGGHGVPACCVVSHTPSGTVTLCARFDDQAVENAFGPMRDISRWYQYQREQERLNSRPPCPLPPTHQHDGSDDAGIVPSPAEHDSSLSSWKSGEERVYDIVANRCGESGGLSLGLRDLAKQGWYWGPITRQEAEEMLFQQSDGTFLVRDSSNDRYLLSVSFRTQSRTFHTRVEYGDGHFSFFGFPQLEVDRFKSVVELIDKSMEHSRNGVFCFSRASTYHSVAIPVRLSSPLSRFKTVQTLQHRCRFVIRQHTRFDLIRELPLPKLLHNYLQLSQY